MTTSNTPARPPAPPQLLKIDPLYVNIVWKCDSCDDVAITHPQSGDCGYCSACDEEMVYLQTTLETVGIPKIPRQPGTSIFGKLEENARDGKVKVLVVDGIRTYDVTSELYPWHNYVGLGNFVLIYKDRPNARMDEALSDAVDNFATFDGIFGTDAFLSHLREAGWDVALLPYEM